MTNNKSGSRDSGLYLERLENGSVLIKIDDKERVIEDYSWASSVAAVSLHGDTAQAWQCALDLHNGIIPTPVASNAETTTR